MSKVLRAVLALTAASFAVTTGRSVENTWDNSVRASSSVQASPARITLTWPQDTNGVPSNYTVYRKSPGATSWGAGTTLAGSATSYVDTNVAPGVPYEYRIVKAAGGYTGYGYIQTGIEVPLVENRGKVVLVVDDTHASALASELTRLQQDLVGDGWTVIRRDVSRNASVASVKSVIKAAYDSDPANVKSVFLFGRVPVPYSGDAYPDGHPDHRGAWPADAYYGDMDGNWTDTSVNYEQTVNTNPAERTRLSNRPGDGKFDQSTLPSAVELQVGRVDLSNMPGLLWTGGPTTLPSELELLRQYLNKDHKFRHRVLNPQRRAIVGDYFGWRNGEAFSSSAYGAYAAFFGADKTRNLNVVHNDARGVWVPELATDDYLCAYGAGAGSYATIAGLGNGANYNNATTPEIVSNNIRAVFTMVFGSWLGDWDSQDNFMRGILATKDYGLTSAWSGRPHWFTHAMGLGETIGYTARLTQNNTGLYQNQIDSSANRTHIALMGDPTLRLHPVAPVSSLTGTITGSVAALRWNASADTVLGYHVYRASSASGPYSRLTSSLVTGTSFTDSNSFSGASYMVRAVKLESTPSGSYHNASQGIFWTASGGTTGPAPDTTAPTVSLTAPVGGSTVVGNSVTISANASDNTGVTGVQFKLNGINLGSEDTTAPYSATWNTTLASNGSAMLTAVARDAAGNVSTATPVTVNVGNAPTTPDDTTPSTPVGGWFDDILPDGATGYGSEPWTWVTANPAPYSGNQAHQSPLASGLHEHAFNWASQAMTVPAGDTLYAYVYLDAANPPSSIMLSWHADNWDHRAYWGADNFGYGTNGTASRRSMGALPATGKWVRLEVPASAVDLEGRTVTGMGFSAYNGRVTWDQTGTSAEALNEPVTPPPGEDTEPDGETPPADDLDTAVPVVSMTAPAKFSTVSGGSVALTASATDNVGVASVQFKLDGVNIGPKVLVAPYTLNWDSRTTTNGTHKITAMATDAAGNKKTSGSVTVTVKNVVDTTAPFVSLSAPAKNAKVSGSSVTLSASATDNIGIASVQFQLDGKNIGAKLLSAPYTLTWDSRTTTNGTHKITAIATDTSGNKKTSGSATISVTNALDKTAPTVSITAPSAGATVSGSSVTLSATAADNVGVAAVQFKIDGANYLTSDATAPYSVIVDTTKLANGTHTFAATARDAAGNRTTTNALTVTVNNDSTTPTTPVATDTVWIDDTLPAGATGYGSGGDAWNWITTNPAPVSGSKAHQTNLASGVHEHAFLWASDTMPVATGDTLFAYVYLDPANPPTEVMLSWNSGTWEHRAYWGANNIHYGTNDTTGRHRVGDLPATGRWVRLEVPASAVALEGQTVTGMSFSLHNGRATFDKAGKSAAGTTTEPNTPVAPSVTLTATDALATIGTTDNAVLTFTRTGSTANSLTIDYTLGGSAVKWNDYARIPEGDMPVSVTIPAGSASTTMTIAAKANTTNASPATATFTLAANAAYSVGTTNAVTITLAGGTTTPPPPDDTTTPPDGTTPPDDTTTPPDDTTPDPVEIGENAALALPQVGDNALTILSPTVLELERITTKQPDPATVTDWNFVSSSGVLTAPAASKFAVTVDGVPVSVKSIGFKRRVRYAPLDTRDLRIGNYLYVELTAPVAEGKTVVVKNPDATLWPATMTFAAKTDPLRNNPAIHVNQEGYVPSFAKQAIIGHYLGSLGELNVSAGSGFKLVNALNGATVYTGSLTARADIGYKYSPVPYQKVLMADFTGFKTPGEYQLVVPGLGASLPFLINEGIAMGFTRTYALGLYHQRSGHDNVMPYTRHTRGAAHTAPAEIPSTLAGYEFTWATIASKNADTATVNPPGVGRQLKDPASQLYPFVNKGKVDVSGGHFDAGDYSKYTINSAQLAHLLLFTADSIAGAGDLDNLGMPESSDGISDILQMAKHETDYIAKLQDADGGFYFIVYPKTREYESDVLPDRGDQQVVWPKNTSATASSVAALAQAASSPKFKAAYPSVASAYLDKAKLGWQFLMNAVSAHGKLGSYQKVTFYGDNYIHNDEIAWAAASLYAATGEAQYHTALKEWFPDPASPDTMRWSWWRMSESWGNAMRTYAFAARSGRLASTKLEATYLAACENQIKLAGNDALTWSRNNAYGSAFPTETKHVMSAGWYFSLDQASDMAVAYQIDPRQDYLDALVGNMNYEAGSNPVNVAYLTGLGLKRQREVVSQYAKNDRRVLPPAGIPIGNIHSNFDYLSNYGASGNELAKLSYPSDAGSSNVYPFYDRWADSWNVSTEFITVNQARGFMASVALAVKTSAKTAPWKSATARIVVPTTVVPLDAPVTLTLTTTGLDLTNARIVWEGRDQQPDYGSTFAFTPKSTGEQWVEAEIVWPDGRRVVAAGTFTANSPVVTWVDDAIPAGAWVNGNESWNWVGGNPAVKSGSKAHQSAISTGLTEHAFNDAASPLVIDVGDKLFAWVYLDPNNIPSELMIHWNNGNWDHRAYWGADNIHYGANGTASRYRVGDIPAAGGWVKLEVPAKAVGLEGANIKGMCFSVFGGRATWDAAGKSSE